VKIVGCWKCAVYGSQPLIASKPDSSPPEQSGDLFLVQTISLVNHGLTQLAPEPPLLVLCLVFQTKRAWQSGSKHWKRWYRGKLRQNMVDSFHCLHRVVPERMSQVLTWSEVRNHKRRTLNTRLSSGTSAGSFACFAGLYRNCTGKAGTKNGPSNFFVPDLQKGSKNRTSLSKPTSWFRFRRVQVHP